MDAVIPTQRVATLAADEATDRLPAQLSCAGVSIAIDRTRPQAGTSVVGAQRFPVTWTRGRRSGSGYVEIGRLSDHAAVVEVALPAGVAVDAAQELRDRLEGRPEPAPPAASSPRGRAGIVLGAVVVLLVMGTASALLLDRPQPISVETATARFREAPGDAAWEGPAEPPAEAREPEDAAPDAQEAVTATEDVAPERTDGSADDPGAQPLAVPQPPEPTPPAADDEPPAEVAAAGPASEPASAAAPPPDQPAPQPPAPQRRRPEAGVYRYATTGWEELSTPGSRRSFPAETAQTVTHTDCGFTQRWQPFEERSDTFALCTADGGHMVLAHAEVHRAFYGHGHDQRFTCEPTAAPPGAAWAARCDDGDATTMEVTARPAGEEVLDVAGQPVPTRKVLLDSHLEGDTAGDRRAVSWLAEDGLLVRTEVTSDLRVQGPFGPVRYREEHQLQLADRTPSR